MKTVCIFNMNKSNITFGEMSSNIVSNLNKIEFESDTNCGIASTDIPVDSETHEILCISLDIKKGEQITNKIKIKAKTILTTKLNNSELLENVKLGEGSFGIVYKGTFRKQDVAIKRLKSVTDDNKSVEEFEKEVSMLDKFRSEYIIHFYGAVFIPKKICLVTEFAKYGSLHDLMKKSQNGSKSTSKRELNTDINNTKPDITILRKFILDMAKEISFLHNNGIVHRDIKPDNLLVFSLEMNDEINAKLTDFGSARNINMMMTNMTFTKGIGTPKYMAPEVLNREKYKMPSDIYSFAITMYETFNWGDAYPKNKFQYAWSIADFVTSGKHLEKNQNIGNEEFDIIEKMWCTDPHNRVEIDKIIDAINHIIH
ncbi:serine/threonine protein kinase, putative [Entamoeba invadens IP1]|uniref:Serine/threonine protein kinase, putative n=1 Tax=Entamoeba invadens IP1 TaxID=370355 RepID=A0A0A1U3H4_ENTIV|nr:serine/threonine protein kinase, putative [Entamoeba invadens IP1]ELP88686.1 serine/threonine protein kinase, putative [Entamoeba invadens IP1]|eukprot:XP_004255457.1 serine/threonine protein kinase, putative [Entamoeba invadens IP1]